MTLLDKIVVLAVKVRWQTGANFYDVRAFIPDILFGLMGITKFKMAIRI